ncbi:hypothetical protein Tco_1402526, partial [Tanacetum coccineum]
MALPSCLMSMVRISKSIATVLSTTMEGIHHHWLSRTSRLSLRITKFRDRVELATRIDPTIFEVNKKISLITSRSPLDGSRETAQTNNTAKFPLSNRVNMDMWSCNCDEKTQKKNDVKARSMLLMALPNEHLLTFNQYKDAKTLFAARSRSITVSWKIQWLALPKAPSLNRNLLVSLFKSEEPVFEVADSDLPQDQEGNLGDNEDEPRDETASRRDWFKKPTPPQEPTDPDWNVGKTTKEGPTQNWLMTIAASTSTDTSLKDFDELMSTPIISLRNGIQNTQRSTHSSYAELEYDFEECYKALSEKLDWENSEGGGDVYSTKRILADTHVRLLRENFDTGTLEEIFKKSSLTNISGDDVANFAIALRMFTRSLVIQKRVEDFQLRVESYQKKINVTKLDTTRPDLRKRHSYTPYKEPQGFIYFDDHKKNMLMRSDELYKFSDGTLTRFLSSLKDITKNINMEYLPKRRWSNLEKKRAHFMIKDINKLLKERRMMRSLEKFVGEHQSDTKVFTMTMEILLEPISNKLLVEHAEFDESNTYVLERFDTSAGNPVKEILLKLNLPDHRSILTDSKMEVKRRSVKVKELQERCTFKAFQVYKSRK